MSNKFQNIISNLIGLGVIALGTVTFLENDNLINFLSLLGVGLALFLFRVSQTKSYLKKVFSRKAGGHQALVSNTEQEDDGGSGASDIIGDMPDPNKEEK